MDVFYPCVFLNDKGGPRYGILNRTVNEERGKQEGLRTESPE